MKNKVTAKFKFLISKRPHVKNNIHTNANIESGVFQANTSSRHTSEMIY